MRDPHYSATRAHGQRVRWGPSDGLPAGIKIIDPDAPDSFLPWAVLSLELHSNLLPQLFRDPRGWRIVRRDFNGKKDWLVQIVNEANDCLCDVWFGECPPNWIMEGFIKIGTADSEPYVWQTYERFSDSSYRRRQALIPALDDALDRWAPSRASGADRWATGRDDEAA